MIDRKMTFGLAAIGMLSAPMAMAAPILVDDFTDAGSIIATLQGNPVEIDVAGAGIIGGTRTMWVSTDNGADPFGTGFAANGLGNINFSNDAGATGQAVLIYDGGGAGSAFNFTFASSPTSMINVDTAGLGGLDFLEGAAVADRAFAFSGSDFDVLPSNATFRAYAWDADGDLAIYDELIGGPDFNEKLSFASFLDTGGGGIAGFDWTKIGALAFSIESNTENFDGSLGSISVVPLPASALLLLGGLGGLAGMGASKRRRRRKS